MLARALRSAIAVLLVAAGLNAPAHAQDARLASGQAVPAAELEALVDGAVTQAMARDHIVGVTVSVVQDGHVVLKKGYGFADVAKARRVDPDRSLFRIGSISKTFTWMLAMDAVQDGALTLDAPINGYLPPRLRIPDEEFRQPIRLRDLMTHTAGFEELLFRGLFVRDPAQVQPLGDYLASHRPGRIWEPGTVAAYSNYGAALAGRAVAQVRGGSWEDVLDARLLGPAGMSHTTGREPYPPRPGLTAPMPAALAADLSQGYRWTGAGYQARPFEHVTVAPAGSISSTAGDMARYMMLRLGEGVIDGRTVYSPGTAARLHEPLMTYANGSVAAGGAFQDPIRGGYVSEGHNGATLNFHSNMALVPALRLGVFVAANTESGGTLTEELPGLVIRRFYSPAPLILAPDPQLLKQARAYDGEFITTRRAFHGLGGFATGLLSTPVAVVAPGYLKIGGARYAPTAPGLFRNVDAPDARIRVVFKDGRAARLIQGAGELHRRDPLHQTRLLGLLVAATVLVAVAVLAGLFSPARWRAPQTATQAWAGRLRGAAAALWLVAVAAFALKLGQALSDNASIIYGWPGPLMLTASGAGLAAALFSGAALLLTPLAWRGGGWSTWRKVRFTATVTVFSAAGGLLAALGALQPWNP